MAGEDCLAWHPQEVYGKELEIVADAGIGPTMAACVLEDLLYAIGRGRLHVFDISNPASPKTMGSLDGLGNTRQIAVDGGIAYITSREHGVFIVDVKNPRDPEMLAHYDPIEVATGVAISGDVLLVACRSYGLSPAQALIAATAGAAEALQLDGDRGTLEPGKLADIQIWDVPVFEDVIYRIGNNAVDTIIKRGQVYKCHQTVLT